MTCYTDANKIKDFGDLSMTNPYLELPALCLDQGLEANKQ
jgi:hypothetical protein